jgi:hypothetical protein
MTVRRATEAYLTYQRASEKRADRTSKLEDTRNQHGKLLGSERDVLDEMNDPTLLFLSLRLSPIEQQNGQRRWIEPIRLDNRLNDSWENVRSVLRYRLREFESQYVAVVAGTTSAATPHRHVLVYVEDPDDEITIDVAEAAVKSHCNKCEGAKAEDHPVEPGESDAAMVFHDPPKVDDVPDETLLDVFKTRGREPFPQNTVPMQYVADQRPHWSLANVYDSESDIHADSPLVDAGAIAWAATHDWISTSRGMSLS